MATKFRKNKPKLHKFLFLAKIEEYFACSVGFMRFVNSNVLPKFSRELRELPWQPNLGKNRPKLHKFQFLARNLEIFACKYGVVEFKYASWIFHRTRELPWQPKLCKNKPKFCRFQFSKSYGDIVCVYGRVLIVGEFRYANENFRGAKGVAIATKFTQKGQKCTDFSSVRNIVPISTYMIRFWGCRIQICYLNLSVNKEHCYGNQIGKDKPKLHKFHFCIKHWEIFSREQ